MSWKTCKRTLMFYLVRSTVNFTADIWGNASRVQLAWRLSYDSRHHWFLARKLKTYPNVARLLRFLRRDPGEGGARGLRRWRNLFHEAGANEVDDPDVLHRDDVDQARVLKRSA
jgi:hypothetical protein